MQLHLSSIRRIHILLGALVIALLALPGASLYYEYSGGRSCARCHEIWQPYHEWQSSAHRDIGCTECHGNVLTLDAGFHLNNIRRLWSHVRNDVPEQIRLKPPQAFQTAERCRKCHQQEWAGWAGSLHSATYTEIFLDPTHNRQRRLADDCLRCHGMDFAGGIRDLVVPLDTTGPWRLHDTRLASRPAINCLDCHQMHRQGLPLMKPAIKPVTAITQKILQPSLALFDRRELMHVSAERLPLPEMRDGERSVKISPDRRQALCYQCHAPLPTFEVASGDDRTPVGVHEGLSCLACHENHGQKTRASCATCHPRLSNCGLEVETMDTTFKSTKSPHNIHFVKCADCHTKGIPKPRPGTRRARLAVQLTVNSRQLTAR